MTKAIKTLSRSEIDNTAWDTCVQASSRRIVYGYSWYLDAVLPAPNWRWVGLVQFDTAGQYQAVMPVPQRRRGIAGLYQKWVVHQPFFCQFLGVFSPDEAVDKQPFFDRLFNQFRYGSTYSVHEPPVQMNQFGLCQAQVTHVLDISVGYEVLFQKYTWDRKLNLRRAKKVNWTIIYSANVEPLLTLFRDYHATTIENGISDWAYAVFRKLVEELTKRDLVVLQYAVQDNRIEAGALFVCESGRAIYLFNAASPIGRLGNARTLLVDQFIRSRAGQMIKFDFESPIKQSIRDFYQSFGAVEEPFYTLRWNRLKPAEKALLFIKRKFTYNHY